MRRCNNEKAARNGACDLPNHDGPGPDKHICFLRDVEVAQSFQRVLAERRA